jgi:hypothetical protein
VTDDTIPSYAEALATIARMGQRIAELEAIIAENSDAVARDVARAVSRGTLAAPTPDDEPATYTHNVPPNAPR